MNRDPDHDPFLDAVFRDLPPVEPSASLRRQVAQIPVAHPRGLRSFWPFPSIWQPVLGWSLAAVLGLSAGFFTDFGAEEVETIGATQQGSTAPSTNDLDDTASAGASNESANSRNLEAFLTLAWSDSSGFEDLTTQSSEAAP